MHIDDTVGGAAQGFFAAASAATSGQSGKSGAGGMLAAAKAGKTGAAGATGAEGGEESEAARDIRLVREKGFRAFIEEMQERKLAELREKILQSMGLTEEELEDMGPDQRAAVERMITDKIRERLSAQTEIENGNDENAKESERVTAETLAARTGFGAGFAVLQALENVELAGQVPRPKDEF